MMAFRCTCNYLFHEPKEKLILCRCGKKWERFGDKVLKGRWGTSMMKIGYQEPQIIKPLAGLRPYRTAYPKR